VSEYDVAKLYRPLVLETSIKTRDLDCEEVGAAAADDDEEEDEDDEEPASHP
jgi:hypothetical protein